MKKLLKIMQLARPTYELDAPMNAAVRGQALEAQTTRPAVVDCDIHPQLRAISDPRYVFRAKLDEPHRHMIFRDNATALYGPE